MQMCFQLFLVSAESNGIIFGDKCLHSAIREQASPQVKLQKPSSRKQKLSATFKNWITNAARLPTNTKEFKMNISEFWMNIQIGITGQ